MKVSILQTDLNLGLATVSRVVTAKGQLPVLANVLVEADRGGISLTATNLELGLKMRVGGKVVEEGSLTVPARSLAEFVTTLPSSSSVEMEADGDKLKIKAGGFGAKFAGIAATEFPVFAKAPGGQANIAIGQKTILDVAKQVAYAAAVDESRPVLTGVQFKTDPSASFGHAQDKGSGQVLVVTATDGFRLARKKFKIQDTKLNEMSGLILPARTILELSRILGEQSQEEKVEMEVVKENNQVIFKSGRTEVISRVLEGNFPEVDKVIPVEFKTTVILEKEELIKAVRAASIFARENNNIVKFNVQSSILKIGARGATSGESEIELEGEASGEDVEIAFNYKYVLDCLGGIGGDRVVLKTSGGMAPGVWGEEKKEDYVALIMPVRV
ncbi:DNA polymerase III subunit beta [Candidatus Amesbacteria bacterium RIFCSPHIGHO2_01_FULL_48_32]|uniref:Beta sliding clamp n=1 Tax=Candidatus Amesbacteria bacterium RIFCSPLOWO2_01_FULL_48_25 TaxID=1797259 RepID=A0A1F4ZBY4_9BACT|nr:MAG: DNA polymerase III subunit beta [Candidatus Amesbacteria bacterium RIFCSPHIGHO2_01_FULL_48_32]OGD03416.1 MAG: DNA polymerase III subunit beta [Candidatus Amesbacteria bacterium RIFCSPLOWO2_01_FULL_48_25]HJZ05033.1 DNA polymerase III subunit beta [Patescibacteria group bacterium]